ncbi:hypothetical protein BaRGS_00014575 [Batillaria attramentaria]|uniref:Chitin-binding type-2 domain-containing protein n=1 Tax=Batillaria attramentaria TaxID=370345 RepID=A0ABD0L3V7_9CAEN
MVSLISIQFLRAAFLVALFTCARAWYEPCKSSGWGKEPNYDDMECHSYYYCEDYWGELKHCPHGYQFDYHEKECLKDEEVLCKWQISESDSSSSWSSSSSSSSWSSSGHGSSHGPHRIECHEEHGKEPDYHAEHCETYYICDHHHGFLQHCPHHHQFDWHSKECKEDKYVWCQEQRSQSHSGHGHHDEHSSSGHSSYECHEEHGKEPDYHAEHCETYYECDHHHGSLQHCPHHYQFDWHLKECLEDKYVYCQDQRSKYHHGHSDVHHEEEHHDSSSSGLDWLYMMSLQNSLSSSSGSTLGGFGGLGGLLAVQGNALQGNALQGNGLQGNALQGNGLQGNALQPGQLPLQPGGFQPNQGLNPQFNPNINVAAPNVNQFQLAGAAGLNPGINQGQAAFFPQAGRDSGPPIGRSAGNVDVDQTQTILVNQEGKVLTPLDQQDEQGRSLFRDQDGNVVAREPQVTQPVDTPQPDTQPDAQPLPVGQSPAFIPPPPAPVASVQGPQPQVPGGGSSVNVVPPQTQPVVVVPAPDPANPPQAPPPNTILLNSAQSLPRASPAQAPIPRPADGQAANTVQATTPTWWLLGTQATARDTRVAVAPQPDQEWPGVWVPDSSTGQWLLDDSEGTWVVRNSVDTDVE